VRDLYIIDHVTTIIHTYVWYKKWLTGHIVKHGLGSGWGNHGLFQCMIYGIKTLRHSIMYCINDVDIKFSTHDTFLE